jgi:ABC-type methionine transport system ATPase subunit
MLPSPARNKLANASDWRPLRRLKAELQTRTAAVQPPSFTLDLFMSEKSRLWLMFPARLITRPVIWELAKKFEVITNVRQASVTDEVGIVSLSLEGEREVIKQAIAWLEELGVKVEPVEINTIEG